MIYYLEYKDEKSSKFWEITLNDKSFSVRFGKIGTEGQTQIKEFGSAEEANKEAEKLLKEKLKKGYLEIKSGDNNTANDVENPDVLQVADEIKMTPEEAKNILFSGEKITWKLKSNDGEIHELELKGCQYVINKNSTFEFPSEEEALAESIEWLIDQINQGLKPLYDHDRFVKAYEIHFSIPSEKQYLVCLQSIESKMPNNFIPAVEYARKLSSRRSAWMHVMIKSMNELSKIKNYHEKYFGELIRAIALGGNIDFTPEILYQTLTRYAVQNDNLSLLEFLYALGADLLVPSGVVNWRDGSSTIKPSLLLLSIIEKNLKITKFLKSIGAKLDTDDKLFAAIKTDDVKLATEAFQEGANPQGLGNGGCGFGWTGNNDIFDILLENGGNKEELAYWALWLWINGKPEQQKKGKIAAEKLAEIESDFNWNPPYNQTTGLDLANLNKNKEASLWISKHGGVTYGDKKRESWSKPSNHESNDITSRLLYAVRIFETCKDVTTKLQADKFKPLDKSELPSILDDIKGDLGFDVPKDLQDNFLNGEQINLKWNISEINGQMNLCGVWYSLIFKRLKDIGHEYLYNSYPTELIDSLFYIDGTNYNEMVLVSVKKDCDISPMYLLGEDDDSLQEMDLSWADYLKYSIMLLGLKGWQRLFTSGLYDDEIELFQKGLELLNRIFPENDLSEIKKRLTL